MTLVLVVAMSTATFAWYTANSSVSATATTIKAESAASNVYISRSDDFSAEETTIALKAGQTLKPMAPTAKVTTTGAEFKNAVKNEGALEATGVVSPYTDTFYLYNDAATAEAWLQATVTVEKTAIVDEDGDPVLDAENNPTYYDDASAYIKYVIIVNGTVVVNNQYSLFDLDLQNDTKENATNNKFSVAAGAKSTVQVIVWLDGTDMDNTDQGAMADVSIKFDATTAPVQG